MQSAYRIAVMSIILSADDTSVCMCTDPYPPGLSAYDTGERVCTDPDLTWASCTSFSCIPLFGQLVCCFGS